MKDSIAQLLLRYLVDIIRKEPVESKMKQLKQTQFLDVDEMKQIHYQNIQRVLSKAFSHVPFYRESFEKHGFHPSQFKSLDDISRVPFLNKLDLKNNTELLRNREYKGAMDRKTTGGSTGQAVTLIKDRIGTAWLRGVMWRCYGWFNIVRGDRTARFWGIPLRQGVRWRYRMIDFLMNRIRLSAFGFSDREMEIYLGRIRKFKPSFFYGYLSMMLEFAYFLKKNGIDGRELNVKAIVSTSEVLYPHQKKFLEDVFGCPVANEYGCGEVGVIAFTCRSGLLHLMTDNLFIEILDDLGKPVAPGEIGEIVVTEMHSTAMPLIRYRMRDFAKKTSSDKVCDCGVSLPVIEHVVGREYDFLISVDGKKYHGEQFMYLLEDLQAKKQGVRQFQLIQTGRDKIVVNIIKEKWAGGRVEKEIADFLHKTLGREINIEFVNVEYIERENSGKIRLIIQKWKA